MSASSTEAGAASRSASWNDERSATDAASASSAAGAAADLRHGRAVETALLGPRRDLDGVGAAEPVREVAPQRAPRGLLVEDVEPLGGAAAARHSASLAHGLRGRRLC